MGIAGWVLFVLGLLSIVLGLLAGAKDVFARQNQPGTHAMLPTGFLAVLKALLEAPASKFFVLVGLIMVIVGLGLNGADVFDATD